jgi:hypothetical protein
VVTEALPVNTKIATFSLTIVAGIGEKIAIYPPEPGRRPCNTRCLMSVVPFPHLGPIRSLLCFYLDEQVHHRV